MDIDFLLPAGIDTKSVVVSCIAFSTLGFLYLLITHRDGRAFGTSPRPDLDTMPGIPLLGNIVRTLKQGQRQLEFWTALRKNQSEESKRMGKVLSLTVPPGVRVIDCTKPEWIEWIQKGNFQNYEKGDYFKGILSQVLGGGIFVSDGEQWYHQRKATSKVFTGNNFRGVITSSIDHDIKKLNTILSRYADSGKPFDLGALFFRFTLDSFCQMAFGQDCGALSEDHDTPVPFADAFDFAQGQLTKRFNNPFWRTFERFTGAGKKMKQATDTIDAFAYDVIAKREKQGLGGVKNEKEVGTDLLSLYMVVRDDNGQPMSRKALRDAVLNLLIAGRDTTAQTLSWTFFHLLEHPEYMTAIRAELDQCGKVDYDTYKTLTNTLAVFHEGLRLHPTVAKNGWIAKNDDHIPNGPFIQKNDIVRWSDWEMARMPEVWGPDAAKFNPGRWIEEDGVTLKKFSQWKAHMFNGGPRLCLGQTLATFEGASVMAAIVKEFDVVFAPGYIDNVEMIDCERTPRYADSLTLPMLEPLMVTISHRKRD